MDKAQRALLPTYPIMPCDGIWHQITTPPPARLLNPHTSSLHCRLCVKKSDNNYQGYFFLTFIQFSQWVAQLMCKTDEMLCYIRLSVTHWLQWRWPPVSCALPCSGPRRCRCRNLPPVWDWRPDPGHLGTLCPLWAPAVLLSPTTPRAQVCREGGDRPPAAGCPLWRPSTSWASCRLSLQWRAQRIFSVIDSCLQKAPLKPLKHYWFSISWEAHSMLNWNSQFC